MDQEQQETRYDLDRFLMAQEGVYEHAMGEIRNGMKTGHWIWYIFPQMKGLGHSQRSYYYGITDLEEARQYLADKILGKRLIDATTALQQACATHGLSVDSIMGPLDAMKVRSSMTLFDQVSPGDIYGDVLRDCFQDTMCDLTMELLNDPSRQP